MRNPVESTKALLLVVGLGCGCGCGSGSTEGAGGTTTTLPTAQNTDATAAFPSELLASEGSGPALFTGPGADAAAIGYVSPAVVLRVAGAPENERLQVRISGPLKVRGWFPVNRLAARVQKRGKIAGTPLYVGPNDLVGVRGLQPDGLMRVQAAPRFERTDAPSIGPFGGTYPGNRLGVHAVDIREAEAPSPGTVVLLPAGHEIQLYDRPGGTSFATLPALTPPLPATVVRERGSWKAVRIGLGPYVLGFIDAPVTPATGATGAGAGEHSADGTPPARLREEAQKPLWRVRSGARVRFDGRTVAIFEQPGWARELNRYDTGEVDVFAAVNDDIAVRGMLQASDLQPVDETAAAPAATPATTP